MMSIVLDEMVTKGDDSKTELSFCEYLNVSVCPITDDGDVSIH